jgi:hypothetical protein
MKVLQRMRLMPATKAPKTLRPEKKRARKTALPPWRAKKASARPNLSGVIHT